MPRSNMNDDDDKVMLCLAALSYRGFSSPYRGADHDDLLRTAIIGDLESDLASGRASLASLERDIGRWKLVWGPASYRVLSSTFDDAMMFVAQKEDEQRYAVAVRGTNPISGFDWLFGDLWVCEKLPWAFGVPEDADENEEPSALSLSTALGLHILRNLRSLPAAGDRRTTPRAYAPIGDSLETLAAGIGRLRHATEPWFDFETGRVIDEPALDRLIRPLVALWESATSNPAFGFLRKAVDPLGRRVHLELYQRLEDGIALRAGLEEGQDLLTFFNGELEEDGPAVRVDVTGHSKGGALAPAVALWLSETRKEWDPHERATIRCWAFAGPTPGNKAFGDRFHAGFGNRFTRVVNPLDIVPRAFDPELLDEVPRLYQPAADCPLLIEHLVKLVINETQACGYSHLDAGLNDILLKRHEETFHWFLEHVLHHHLDGYFVAAGLPYRVRHFFAPFA